MTPGKALGTGCWKELGPAGRSSCRSCWSRGSRAVHALGTVPPRCTHAQGGWDSVDEQVKHWPWL